MAIAKELQSYLDKLQAQDLAKADIIKNIPPLDKNKFPDEMEIASEDFHNGIENHIKNAGGLSEGLKWEIWRAFREFSSIRNSGKDPYYLTVGDLRSSTDDQLRRLRQSQNMGHNVDLYDRTLPIVRKLLGHNIL